MILYFNEDLWLFLLDSSSVKVYIRVETKDLTNSGCKNENRNGRNTDFG
jgi:hypothetical protein